MSETESLAPGAWSPLTTALAGTAALAVAMGVGRFAFTPVLPMMLQDAGLTLAQGGWLASANYLGYLLGAMSAMALRMPAERVIRGGLVAIAALTLAMALRLPFSAWMLLRLLAGVASAWVLISVSGWSLEVLARHRRPGLGSMVFAGVGAGIAAAGLLCIALLAVHARSWHAWSMLGVLSALATAFVWPVFRARAQATAVNGGARVAGRWDARSLRLVFCYGAYGFGYIIPATFLPVMAKKALHGSALFGWSWPLFGLAAMLSMPVAARLGARFGYRRVWIGCQGVMAVGVLLPAVWSNLAAVVGAALCVGGTFVVITLAGVQEARRVAGSRANALIAAMTAAFALGQVAGPLAVTLTSGGFSAALLFAAAVLAASLVLLKDDAPGRGG